MAEQAAEKGDSARRISPQRLKPHRFHSTYGTTDVVPLQHKHLTAFEKLAPSIEQMQAESRASFSAACEAVPLQNAIYATGSSVASQQSLA